jgi:hypothetical protein
MYNALNHTQWNGINAAATFDASGKLTHLPAALGGGGGRWGFGALGRATGSSLRDPRKLQIGAKLHF